MMIAVQAFHDEKPQAQRLADAMELTLQLVDTHVFPDGECVPRVAAPAPTTLVYRSLHRPNEKLVELLLAADAWRRNGAQRLVLVSPYLPYMRQDKAFQKGEPVSQRVIASLLDGVFDRIVTVDPHLHRTHALSDIFQRAAVTHIHSADALVPYLREAGLDDNLVIVGPDAESASWVRNISTPLGLSSIVLTKQRRGDRNVAISVPANCEIRGRPALLVDDICSSGATLSQAARALLSAGSTSVAVYVTHALFASEVQDQMRAAGVERVISTDSCDHPTNAVHLAPTLAAALANEV